MRNVWPGEVLGAGFRNMKRHLWHIAWTYSGDLQKMCKWHLLDFSFVIELRFPTCNISCLNVSGAVSSYLVPCLHGGDRNHVLLSFCLSWSPLLCLYIPLHSPMYASLHCIFWNTNLSHMLIIIIILDSYPELRDTMTPSTTIPTKSDQSEPMCVRRSERPLNWASKVPLY